MNHIKNKRDKKMVNEKINGLANKIMELLRNEKFLEELDGLEEDTLSESIFETLEIWDTHISDKKVYHNKPKIQKILKKVYKNLKEIDSTEAYEKAMDIVYLYTKDGDLEVDYGTYEKEDYRHLANKICKCMY